MMKSLFKKNRYITVPNSVPLKAQSVENKKELNDNKPTIPTGMWSKCQCCGQLLYKSDLEEHLMTCQFCKTHTRMSATERITSIIDDETFQEFDQGMSSLNPLDYSGYENKIESLIEETGLNEAVITGKGSIKSQEAIVVVMDSRFMMGSMGSVVGEKITRAIEIATLEKLPIIIFTASGGARMQEGIFSLMQMAKVSAALSKHREADLLYITVLTDPTTGGVTASFAMLGDIILAEPGALIGFAGRRVIEQTIKQKLPEEFQKAEFLLKHGFVDKVVHREKLKETLSFLLLVHNKEVI
jgi:acetyl-CoA carboxylase carboxyl transferase beta subunit